MEHFYDAGIEVIRRIQLYCEPETPCSTALAQIGYYVTTDNIVNLLVPLVFIFNQWKAFKLLLGLAIAGNLCLIAKWGFLGRRPYWHLYLRSQNGTFASALPNPPSICESSFGAPSCHTTIASVVAAFFIAFALRNSHLPKSKRSQCLLVVSVCVSAGLVFLVWSSRLFFGVSYVYQLALGVILGSSTAITVNALPWKYAQWPQLAVLPGFFLGWYYLSMHTLRWFGPYVDEMQQLSQLACNFTAVQGPTPSAVVDISAPSLALWKNCGILTALVVGLELLKRGESTNMQIRALAMGLNAVVLPVITSGSSGILNNSYVYVLFGTFLRVVLYFGLNFLVGSLWPTK